MSALELVQSRCLRVQRNQGKPPTSLGTPAFNSDTGASFGTARKISL